jgi:hypothetical protein
MDSMGKPSLESFIDDMATAKASLQRLRNLGVSATLRPTRSRSARPKVPIAELFSLRSRPRLSGTGRTVRAEPALALGSHHSLRQIAWWGPSRLTARDPSLRLAEMALVDLGGEAGLGATMFPAGEGQNPQVPKSNPTKWPFDHARQTMLTLSTFPPS